jgi:hypothetical protein
MTLGERTDPIPQLAIAMSNFNFTQHLLMISYPDIPAVSLARAFPPTVE